MHHSVMANMCDTLFCGANSHRAMKYSKFLLTENYPMIYSKLKMTKCKHLV